MKTLDVLLDELRKINLNGIDINLSFQETQKIYFEIYRNYINEIRTIQLKHGMRFYRVRKNIEDLRFSNPKELFSPPSHLTYFGRVNLKNSPVYYCSDNSSTSILETKLQEGDYFTLIENILLEDISIVAIGNCNRYTVKSKISNKLKKFDVLITELISRDVNNPVEYLKTATLGNTLMSDNKYDGIMFPSIYAEKSSDNFALKTEKLGDILMFENARLFKVAKKINPKQMFIECIENSNRLSATGSFIWTKVNNCKTHEIKLDLNPLCLE